MSRVLVDSNVLLDVLDPTVRWHAWSVRRVGEHASPQQLVINPLIYAEISINYPNLEDLDRDLPTHLFFREDLPWEAAFAAGKAFLAYRRRGGTRPSPLPDFYIGAHAEAAGYRLLTRDRRRYETYFPQVELITP